MRTHSRFLIGILVLWVVAGFTYFRGQASPHPQIANPSKRLRQIMFPTATYYVATTGSDSNDGSAANPWRTVQHAVDQVNPSDIILVHGGSYLGARIEQSGTAAAPITLKAAPGATVVVNGPGPNNKHNSNIEIETWEGDGVVAYWAIEGLQVTGAPNWGIDIRGSETAKNHHITIRGNKVYNNGTSSGTTGIFAAFTDDVLIENNESYSNGEHGVYVNNSSDRFIVRGNILHHNTHCGLHLNGDAESGGDGIMSDGLVEDNTIYENGANGGGCSGVNMDGVTNTVVRNNLLYSNHGSGIAVFQENGALCSQNNRLLHNTILMASDARWAITVGSTDNPTGCVNNQIFNNIIYSNHSYRGSITLFTSNLSGFQSDYNVVVDRFSTDDGDSVITLAAWQALGYDTHSFIASPEQLFANTAGNDYHLRAGSPAIDKGKVLTDISADKDGQPRPSGAGYDIGAYEYHTGGGGSQTPRAYLPLVVKATAPPSPTPSPTSTQTPTPTPTQPVTGGHITYRLNNFVYRVAAQQGATPQNISQALNQLSTGDDYWLNISPDGSWLLLSSTRFDPTCAGWACLALLTADLSSTEVVQANGSLLHPDFSAVASGGNLIVYPDEGGPHTYDLWAITRSGGAWGAPTLLTGSSPYTHNTMPAISADGAKVVFDCGNLPYGQQGTAICEVGTDGAGFRVVLTPAQGPGGSAQNALHQPDFAPDGSIVFEADWTGEQIWRLPSSSTTPILLAATYTNDNSPCLLPDGRIVSLWLERPENNTGAHEIKTMTADGNSHIMVLTGADVEDGGLGCGQ